MLRTLIYGARQIVTVTRNNNEKFLCGKDMHAIGVIKSDAGGLSLMIENENIVAIGTDDAIARDFEGMEIDNKIDASGCCILPGFVDAHTHPIWAGDRVHEYAKKLAGATYMEIMREGGGIGFTVEQTKLATDEELLIGLVARLKRMLHAGTTYVECKTGYGLEWPDELRLLKLLEQARSYIPIGISITYCAAHAVPKNKTAEEMTEDIINKQIKALRQLIDNKEIDVNDIDVFCEKGVYDIEQSRRILLAGQQIGLSINFHGDELNYTGSAEMGAEIGARAISHLECISEEGIRAMANAKTFAVILPHTGYILRIEMPPVRKMIDAGVPVALGTDANPNAFSSAMSISMNLACVLCHMSLEEALAAATINSAAALGISDKYGSIEVGKKADLIICRCPSWEHIIYQFGDHTHIIRYVLKHGEVVYAKSA
ncbi:unnamed protein product [Rotaria sordida]|uniref:Probable imidazolonepropionase n=1 Tax=Rotaria sordida TaxID=392033 RepID=A0A813TM97_9BILA|nr:unnamed protein product [Rotaria sordida]CAF0902731.1 unnamed protein product [Rotaria sordida]CAF3656180.1 unnamed protein product [Rotaria sordida]